MIFMNTNHPTAWIVRLTLVLAVALILPQALHANPLTEAGLTVTEANALATAMSEAGYDAAAIIRIAEQIRLCEGQPTAIHAVVNKVREGLSKGVGSEGVAQAAARVRERIAFAHQSVTTITNDTNRAETATMLADSLASGLSRDDATHMVGELSQHRAESNAFAALVRETVSLSRDMTRLGISSPTVGATVHQALSRGYAPADIGLVRQTVDDLRDEPNLEATIDRMLTAMRQGVAPGQLKGQAQGKNGKGAGGQAGKGGASNGKGSGAGGAGGGAGSGGKGGGGGGGGGRGGGNGGGGGGGGK